MSSKARRARPAPHPVPPTEPVEEVVRELSRAEEIALSAAAQERDRAQSQVEQCQAAINELLTEMGLDPARAYRTEGRRLYALATTGE